MTSVTVPSCHPSKWRPAPERDFLEKMEVLPDEPLPCRDEDRVNSAAAASTDGAAAEVVAVKVEGREE